MNLKKEANSYQCQSQEARNYVHSNSDENRTTIHFFFEFQNCHWSGYVEHLNIHFFKEVASKKKKNLAVFHVGVFDCVYL